MPTNEEMDWQQWVESTLPQPMQDYQEAFLRQMAELTSHAVDFPDGGAQLTPETMTAAKIALQNSVERADREIDRQVEARVWGGEARTRDTWANTLLSTYRDLNAAPLTNGELLTPGTCHRCGATGPTVPRRCGAKDCMSTVCVDLCVGCVTATGNRPPRRYRHIGEFLDDAGDPFDAVRYSAADEVDANIGAAFDSLSQRVSGAPNNSTATGAMMAHAEERGRRLAEQAADRDYNRPDHYRVRPGFCFCGFNSYFERDMELHIADDLVEGPNGIPGRLRRCEQCGGSRWCRKVAVMRPQPARWGGPTTDVPLPAPTTERVYRCTDCTRGLS